MTKGEQSPEHVPDEGGPVRITRYPNRRLYDRTQAKYITLLEIADMVRQGKTVTVRDYKSGEDMTRTILTQIILEHHPERMDLFPVGVLNSMIRANETTLGFLRDYLFQSLGYLEMLQRSTPLNPLVLPMTWLRTLLPNVPLPQVPASSTPAGEADAAALASRVAELERRLEELRAGAEKSAPEPGSRAKTPRRDGRGPKA